MTTKILPDNRRAFGAFEAVDFVDEREVAAIRSKLDVDVPMELHWTWEYGSEVEELRQLYERGKRAQWNAETHEVIVGNIQMYNSSVMVDTPPPIDPFDAPEKSVRLAPRMFPGFLNSMPQDLLSLRAFSTFTSICGNPALKKRRRSLPEEALLLPEDLRQLPRCRIRILPTTIRRSRTTLSRKPGVRRPHAFSPSAPSRKHKRAKRWRR